MREAPRQGPPPLRLPVLRLPAGWRHLSEDELLQRAAQAYLAHRAQGDRLVGSDALMPPKRPGGLPERRQADRRGPSSWPEPEPRLRPTPPLPPIDPVAFAGPGEGATVPSTGHASEAAMSAAAALELGRSGPAEPPTAPQAALRRPSISGWFLAGAIFLAVVQVVLALVALAPKAFDPRPGQQHTGPGTRAQTATPGTDQTMPSESALSQVLPTLAPPALNLQGSPSAQAASR